MEIRGRKRLMVFSGSANVGLAREVASILGTELGGVERSVFANGEIYVHYTESVRGADCFVVQSHTYPINFHIMEQLIMIDALKRASAKRITAVVPFYGYARQDKKGRPREPISARLMADLFKSAGADRIVSVDLHTGQIQGFVDTPFDHLTATPVFVDYLRDTLDGPTTIVSPDTGRVKVAAKFARHLDSSVAFVHKRRRTDIRNEVAAMEIIGDVEDRHCIVVDDMIDTAGTAVAAAELLRQRGALDVRLVATHGVLSPPAVDRLKNAPIREVVISNTLPVPDDASNLDKLTVLSIGSLLAGTINAIFTDASVSEIFAGENVDAAAVSVADAVLRRFSSYVTAVGAINHAAARSFALRDWDGMAVLTSERLDAYTDAVGAAVAELRRRLDDKAADPITWAAAHQEYAALVAERPDVEIAETFYNSITRRFLTTEGVDARVEFLERHPLPPSDAVETRRHVVDAGLEAALEAAVTAPQLAAAWQNLRRDVRLAVVEIERSLGLHGMPASVDEIELLVTPFFRGHGAYLVGRLWAGGVALPLGIAVHHTNRGLAIGAVLTEADDVSVLFSYTRAAFFVAAPRPAAPVAYLAELLPDRSRDELYTALGYRKHGKTELFRDLSRHIATSGDRFEFARGIRGMVMIVFTAPGFGVVFKIIRDRFPYPKQTTRRRIMSKYRLVSRHDRAGRLVDAHEFEHLRFARSRFTPELLEELAVRATRSVSIDDDYVTLHHVYVERRLAPLDLYVREANPIKARAAIIDYGRAIKNLAAANIFPGDMLLKNFGVTKGGRVVFYDYDEIVPLTQCKFREMPDSDRADEEMSAEPWFGVGDDDVFPEEFTRFLGIRGELREAFDEHHADLFGVRFWTRMQNRLNAGEVIEIFPYKRSRRLGAVLRR